MGQRHGQVRQVHPATAPQNFQGKEYPEAPDAHKNVKTPENAEYLDFAFFNNEETKKYLLNSKVSVCISVKIQVMTIIVKPKC